MRLRTDSPEFVAEMRGRFDGFLGDAAQPDHVFDIELTPFLPEAERDGIDAHKDTVEVSRNGALWQVRRGDFFAEWDPLSHHGRARMVPSPYSLDSVIRILHTLLLAEQGGMLMHASSVVSGGRAWAFTGVSGAGKTTISRLAPTHSHILTDEMSFLRPEDGRYFAYGTPFSGELGRPGENLRAPLAGVFLLAKGQENRIDTLTPSAAVRALMANILYFANDDALTARVFDNAIALASRVPVRKLTFVPDAHVWDMIDAQP
ncbi:hypothetical protein [Thermomonas sp. HDW16]|uniref:hypothetical protein n=1 Tax=Thermomonas sp. HDW16 TaxID=2714945 RepID=UPI0014081589|nr:hypothetical protein [Thermomonas sp. HDW16]QIL20524.1 hypothetical protein G7079_07140 [Thermomonas sp. HDW16]